MLLSFLIGNFYIWVEDQHSQKNKFFYGNKYRTTLYCKYYRPSYCNAYIPHLFIQKKGLKETPFYYSVLSIISTDCRSSQSNRS